MSSPSFFFFLLAFLREKERKYLYYSFTVYIALILSRLCFLRLPPLDMTFMCVQFVVKSPIVGGPFLFFFPSRFLEIERDHACMAKFLQVQI